MFIRWEDTLTSTTECMYVWISICVCTILKKLLQWLCFVYNCSKVCMCCYCYCVKFGECLIFFLTIIPRKEGNSQEICKERYDAIQIIVWLQLIYWYCRFIILLLIALHGISFHTNEVVGVGTHNCIHIGNVLLHNCTYQNKNHTFFKHFII